MPAVLITGANRGLGLEFARQYAAAGYRVYATARAPSASKELTDLAKTLRNVSLHALEVAEPASVAALATALKGEPIDILLNNAGTMGPKGQRFGELDYDGLAETFAINTLAPLRMAEAFVEHVAKSERKLIVAISSGMGSIADSSGGYYAYRASKAALNMSFHNLGLDLKSRGIIAFVINPGWVQTDMGGAGAPTKVADSIAAMRKVFDGMTPAQAGAFMDYKGGTLTW